MKKYLLALLLVAVCLFAVGCGTADKPEEPKDKVFDISEYGLTLKTPDEFTLSDSETNFDLQITDGNSCISFMAYKKIDLAEGQTPESVYDFHNEDMFSRRENVEVINEKKSEVYAGRNVMVTRYSAELDGNKNYYDSYLVDFTGEDTFVWVLVTSVPSQLEAKGSYYKNIVLNLRVKVPSADEQDAA